jgi:hypothetical protein
MIIRVSVFTSARLGIMSAEYIPSRIVDEIDKFFQALSLSLGEHTRSPVSPIILVLQRHCHDEV